jgi:hypothetical protein
MPFWRINDLRISTIGYLIIASIIIMLLSGGYSINENANKNLYIPFNPSSKTVFFNFNQDIANPNREYQLILQSNFILSFNLAVYLINGTSQTVASGLLGNLSAILQNIAVGISEISIYQNYELPMALSLSIRYNASEFFDEEFINNNLVGSSNREFDYFFRIVFETDFTEEIEKFIFLIIYFLVLFVIVESTFYKFQPKLTAYLRQYAILYPLWNKIATNPFPGLVLFGLYYAGGFMMPFSIHQLFISESTYLGFHNDYSELLYYSVQVISIVVLVNSVFSLEYKHLSLLWSYPVNRSNFVIIHLLTTIIVGLVVINLKIWLSLNFQLGILQYSSIPANLFLSLAIVEMTKIFLLIIIVFLLVFILHDTNFILLLTYLLFSAIFQIQQLSQFLIITETITIFVVLPYIIIIFSIFLLFLWIMLKQKNSIGGVNQ